MHLFSLPFFVLVLVFLKVSNCAWENGNNGIDRPGGNLPNMPVQLNVSDLPNACYQLCQSNQQCVAWAYCDVGCCLPSNPACYLKNSVPQIKPNNCAVSGVKNAGLLPPKYVRLPIGSITPEGWLKEQLMIQRNGLSGHLQLFWADIENSSWIGGRADIDLHERMPYWLNGVYPMAHQLQDQSLINTVHQYITYISSHQTSDGWLGPDDDDSGNMYWSKYYMMFVMIQYYEATGNSTILPVMFKFLHEVQTRMLFRTPLGSEKTWSGTRWQDLVLSIHWLLDNAPSGQEQFLWDLAEMVELQGLRWKDYFKEANFPNDTTSTLTMSNHGVNIGMAIKSGAVWYRQSKDQTDTDSSYQRMEIIDKYHGQASGIFSCDEHLGGLMPSRGTELCTVVEAMFSYEVLFGIHGDPVFAEKAELITYNALPATFTSDMWAHQYLQQSNGVNAIKSDDHVWVSDGPEATLYGLEPNFGCCTANFNQGWPKMAQSVAMMSPDGNTIAIGMYAPVSFKYKGASLTITTDYPFDETVKVSGVCSSPKTVEFRIPSWADGATLSNANGTKRVAPGTLVPVACNGSFNVKLVFPMKIRVQRRYNNAASVYHGALLYALHFKEDFQILRNYSFLSRDYQVTPASTWNYAIKITNDSNAESDIMFSRIGLQANYPPFSIDGSPTRITVKGSIVEWSLDKDSASAPPKSPVSSLSNSVGMDVILLPFGATNLRIAEIPSYT